MKNVNNEKVALFSYRIFKITDNLNFTMKKIVFLALMCIALTWTSCNEDSQGCLPVTTDQAVTLNQFLGTWYEIASIPQFFNIGCSCTTATYSIDPSGNGVTVQNSCMIFNGLIPNNITGLATQPDLNDFSKLKVSFPGIPGEADYWILDFAPDASYMLVGNPDKDNLYILSRTATLDPTIYNTLLGVADLMCFDISEVVMTDQSNCD